MELTASGTALIVIDMQNSFCSGDGGCAKAGLPVENLTVAIGSRGRLTAAARESNVPVIHTRYVLRPEYSGGGVIIHELAPPNWITKPSSSNMLLLNSRKTLIASHCSRSTDYLPMLWQLQM